MTPKLNVDVLAIVCEFLTDAPDILSLALTCSSIHPIAIRWLLYMGPVFLKNDLSILRFHSFLLTDISARAVHILALDVDLTWLNMYQTGADHFSLLLDILASCEFLEHVTITFGEASKELIDDPRFVHTITKFRRLHSFSVRSGVVDTLPIIRHICTPLLKLSIREAPDDSAWYPSTLEKYIPRLVARTLKKLELNNLAVDQHHIQGPSSQPILSTIEYPAVRSLTVRFFDGRPLLEHLFHLFPAIDNTLSLGNLDIGPGGEEAYDQIRALNKQAQDNHGAWKKLDRVVCDGAMLYALGLRCPVRLVIINSGWLSGYSYAGDALRENPAPRLKITLRHEELSMPAFRRVFSPELAETLTHLTVCMTYDKVYQYNPPQLLQGALYTCSPPQLQWDDVLVRPHSI